MRLIDADKLIEETQEHIDEWNGWEYTTGGMKIIQEVIREMPTIDAEPVRHGNGTKAVEIKAEQQNTLVSTQRDYAVGSAEYERQKNYIKTLEVRIKELEEKRHGHWEDCSNGWMCSVCNHDARKEYNYCPNCGARMDEVNDEVN